MDVREGERAPMSRVSRAPMVSGRPLTGGAADGIRKGHGRLRRGADRKKKRCALDERPMRRAARSGCALLAAVVATGCVTVNLPRRSFRGPLPAATPQQVELQDRLRAHVRTLAGTIGERNCGRPEALEAAAEYIERTLEAAGYQVAEQRYRVAGYRLASTEGGVDVPAGTVRNLEVSVGGEGGEVVVVGAHYDTAPGTPGADDNASGVAAALELARSFHGRKTQRTVRFVFFVNEEPPFFQTEEMGSLVYARRCRERSERVTAMLSLETLGYYSEAENSQWFPFPFGFLYPERGDFVFFVSDPGSRGLLRRVARSFRRSVALPSRGGAAPPRWVQSIEWSDHWSFRQFGYPAVMVTDTAFLRYRHYHEPTDTPEQLDYDRLARVVEGLAGVLEDLSRPSRRLEPRRRSRVLGPA